MSGSGRSGGCRGHLAVVLRRAADEHALLHGAPSVLTSCWSEVTLIALPDIPMTLLHFTSLSGVTIPDQVLAAAEHDAELRVRRVVAALPPGVPARFMVHSGWRSRGLRDTLQRGYDAVLFASLPGWWLDRRMIVQAARRGGAEVLGYDTVA